MGSVNSFQSNFLPLHSLCFMLTIISMRERLIEGLSESQDEPPELRCAAGRLDEGAQSLARTCA